MHTCNICKKHFKETKDLKKHISNGHKEVKSEIVKKSISQQNTENQKKKKEGVIYKKFGFFSIEGQKCQYCGRFFALKELQAHISAMHECNVCKKHFENLQLHISKGHKEDKSSNVSESIKVIVCFK